LSYSVIVLMFAILSLTFNAEPKKTNRKLTPITTATLFLCGSYNLLIHPYGSKMPITVTFFMNLKWQAGSGVQGVVIFIAPNASQ